MHKHYRLTLKTTLLLILSFSVNAAQKVYTLNDIQGTWWGECNDETAVFYIDGDNYGGDFAGSYKVGLSNNKLLFKNGLPEGHSINTDGKPQEYLILFASKEKLSLQHKGDDTFSFNVYSCE